MATTLLGVVFLLGGATPNPTPSLDFHVKTLSQWTTTAAIIVMRPFGDFLSGDAFHAGNVGLSNSDSSTITSILLIPIAPEWKCGCLCCDLVLVVRASVSR
uniref:Uncharacterized protein n=1 Tax=Setaria viridis TaxID=4556 RepID=A0A4U6SY53_SETVI|nr:hypothetical protein SEVIR_9G161566v2 [Setaria viridis]